MTATLVASTASTTLVLVVLLAALGLALVATCIWLVRTTRTDSAALGPLEVLGGRRFWRAPVDQRAAALDHARPDGATPPAPMVPFDDDLEPEPVEPVAEPVELVEPVEPAAIEADVEPDADATDAFEVEPPEPAEDQAVESNGDHGEVLDVYAAADDDQRLATPESS